jgi:hypothetical protein
MDKDPAARFLATPPILITNYTQELIRDLIKLRVQATKITNPEGPEALEICIKFVWAWNELKCVIRIMMAGQDDADAQKARRADECMVKVLGEHIVEETRPEETR